MSEFQYYFGQKALSDFRLERLLAKVKHTIPSVESLSAQKIYFVQLTKDFSSEQEEKLANLLETTLQENVGNLLSCISILRVGLPSSWSSKALDIFHRCGIKDVLGIEQGIYYAISATESFDINLIYPLLHDSSSESMITKPEEAKILFELQPPVEAQTNSEGSGREIFRALWRVNGRKNTQAQSTLFSMIKQTHVLFSGNVLLAYNDSAAVIAGEHNKHYFAPNSDTHLYQYRQGTYDIVMKVKTSNHSIAISPYSGAAAGVAEEIRDEAATGRGAKSRAGLSGFTVSHLHIPHFERPWENHTPRAPHIASPLRIMIEAPVGAASVGNEYGRPQIAGYFRTFANDTYGYDQPICVSGGLGVIEHQQIYKQKIVPETPLIALEGDAAQEVINRCVERGVDNPMVCINSTETGYLLAVEEADLPVFKKIADRERCFYRIVEQVQKNSTLPTNDSVGGIREASIPAGIITPEAFDTNLYDWKEAAERILTLPCVASKQFLISIADRSVGGLVARDPLVGPWQVPVADVGVIADNFKSDAGMAMAMGERPVSAIISPKASVRLAITEAVLNIAAASIGKLSEVKLSANWMAACGMLAQDSALYEGVYDAAMNFCANLNLCIPVGDESLSMRTSWENNNEKHEQISPLSLIVSAFAPVIDVKKTITPALCLDTPDTRLILIDLGRKKNRLGGSALAQVYQDNKGESPTIDNDRDVKSLFTLIQTLNTEDKLLAYHDRSDGGLLSCIAEMAFASHSGVLVQLESLGDDPKAALFTEEPGVVIQVRAEDRDHIFELAKEHELADCVHIIGRPHEEDRIIFRVKNHVILEEERPAWQKLWQETSAYIQALRDNPECAKQEWEMLCDNNDPGLNNVHTSFAYFPPAIPQHLPRIAILREQGISGHSEMAAAFDAAGFHTEDVHMSDIVEKRVTLDPFVGIVACGGFSYGDVLGAGRGWANSILYNPYVLNQFQVFFNRLDTFALGVSNGCQMFSHLKNIIPGAEHWPTFTRNLSEQFEARLSMVQIEKTPSWLFERMKGSQLPVVVSHATGQVVWTDQAMREQASPFVTQRYVDHYGVVTEHYPENPNGSPQGCAGLTSKDGRFNIMMTHPERVFRNIQLSWRPKDWTEEYSPWIEMFMSVRRKY